MITVDSLKWICPDTPLPRLAQFVDPLNQTFEEFGIENQAEFLAQVAHESMGFIHTRELWGPTDAQKRYDTRADLGNTRPEAIRIATLHGSTPGRWWRGHGLIQTTGYDNHMAVGHALGLDLANYPEQLEGPLNAACSAGHFWKSHSLDDIADFMALTKRINGGLNGYPDRLAYLVRAQEAVA